jgi:hypothetical protein
MESPGWCTHEPNTTSLDPSRAELSNLVGRDEPEHDVLEEPQQHLAKDRRPLPPLASPPSLPIADEIAECLDSLVMQSHRENPWLVRLLTTLVHLRADDKSPKWQRDAHGNWVEAGHHWRHTGASKAPQMGARSILRLRHCHKRRHAYDGQDRARAT